MYDYTPGFSIPVGLFTGVAGISAPSTTAYAMQAMYQLTGDPNSAIRHSFSPSKLNYTATGLPAAAGFSSLSGGRTALFENSAGEFFIFVWNEENTYGGAAVPVTINFPTTSMTSVTEFVPSNTSTTTAPMTAVQTVTSAKSITINLAPGETHLLRVVYPVGTTITGVKSVLA